MLPDLFKGRAVRKIVGRTIVVYVFGEFRHGAITSITI